MKKGPWNFLLTNLIILFKTFFFPGNIGDFIVKYIILLPMLLLISVPGNTEAREPSNASSIVESAKKNRDKLSPELAQTLNDVNSNRPIRVLIRLKGKKIEQSVLSNSKHRRRQVLRKLRKQAQTGQNEIIGMLKRKRAVLAKKIFSRHSRKSNRVSTRFDNIKQYWVSKTLALDLYPEEIEALAERSDVLGISKNTVVSVPPVDIMGEDEGGSLNLWNFAAIGLDQILDLDLDGKGVRVGLIDTGINSSHPDLVGKLGAWAEFDSDGKKVDSEPHETHRLGHGTHVASVLAGSRTGIAPGITLITALALPEGSGSTEQILSAMEWVLDPDQDPDTDDGAQAVNMSFGAYGTSEVLRDAAENMIKAGVLPVGAIGNYGSDTTISPGNSPGTIGVGALDENDDVAYFSGGGEVCWDDTCVLKPNVSAPGVSIPGIGLNGNYQSLSGTSFSAPHIAAAAALMLEYHPGLTPAQMNAFLSNTARDLGSIGSDYRYGQGGLDLERAFDFLQSYKSRFAKNDLVLATVEESTENLETYRFYSHFNDGTGNFVEATTTPQFSWQSGKTKVVGLGDVTGDGYADLVVEQTRVLFTGDIDLFYLVFPSLDAGGFSSQESIWYTTRVKADSESLKTIGLSDVNGDGIADLILVATEELSTSHYQDKIQVLLSNGKSAFETQSEPWSSYSYYTYYYNMNYYGLADINGDGFGDLVVSKRSRYYDTLVYCSLAHSNGSRFQDLTASSVIYTAYDNGPLTHVTSADVNDDGFDDLIFSTEVLSNANTVTPVYVCFGSSTGNPGSSKIWANLPAGVVVAASDFDGDGASDLVVKNGSTNPVLEIWLSDQRDGFIKDTGTWIDCPEEFEGAEIGFIGAGNIGLGNWQ
jgi:subtilisin family serine protease